MADFEDPHKVAARKCAFSAFQGHDMKVNFKKKNKP
jgi:hypothetical protein